MDRSDMFRFVNSYKKLDPHLCAYTLSQPFCNASTHCPLNYNESMLHSQVQCFHPVVTKTVPAVSICRIMKMYIKQIV